MAHSRTTHIGGVYSIFNQRQTSFFFNSSGIEGLKNFIIQGNKKIVEKLLSEIEKMTKEDKKLRLVNMKFLMDACKNLSKNKLNSLSDTARDFSSLFNHL